MRPAKRALHETGEAQDEDTPTELENNRKKSHQQEEANQQQQQQQRLTLRRKAVIVPMALDRTAFSVLDRIHSIVPASTAVDLVPFSAGKENLCALVFQLILLSSSSSSNSSSSQDTRPQQLRAYREGISEQLRRLIFAAALSYPTHISHVLERLESLQDAEGKGIDKQTSCFIVRLARRPNRAAMCFDLQALSVEEEARLTFPLLLAPQPIQIGRRLLAHAVKKVEEKLCKRRTRFGALANGEHKGQPEQETQEQQQQQADSRGGCASTNQTTHRNPYCMVHREITRRARALRARIKARLWRRNQKFEQQRKFRRRDEITRVRKQMSEKKKLQWQQLTQAQRREAKSKASIAALTNAQNSKSMQQIEKKGKVNVDLVPSDREIAFYFGLFRREEKRRLRRQHEQHAQLCGLLQSSSDRQTNNDRQNGVGTEVVDDVVSRGGLVAPRANVAAAMQDATAVATQRRFSSSSSSPHAQARTRQQLRLLHPLSYEVEQLSLAHEMTRLHPPWVVARLQFNRLHSMAACRHADVSQHASILADFLIKQFTGGGAANKQQTNEQRRHHLTVTDWFTHCLAQNSGQKTGTKETGCTTTSVANNNHKAADSTSARKGLRCLPVSRSIHAVMHRNDTGDLTQHRFCEGLLDFAVVGQLLRSPSCWSERVADYLQVLQAMTSNSSSRREGATAEVFPPTLRHLLGELEGLTFLSKYVIVRGGLPNSSFYRADKLPVYTAYFRPGANRVTAFAKRQRKARSERRADAIATPLREQQENLTPKEQEQQQQQPPRGEERVVRETTTATRRRAAAMRISADSTRRNNKNPNGREGETHDEKEGEQAQSTDKNNNNNRKDETIREAKKPLCERYSVSMFFLEPYLDAWSGHCVTTRSLVQKVIPSLVHSMRLHLHNERQRLFEEISSHHHHLQNVAASSPSAASSSSSAFELPPYWTTYHTLELNARRILTTFLLEVVAAAISGMQYLVITRLACHLDILRTNADMGGDINHTHLKGLMRWYELCPSARDALNELKHFGVLNAAATEADMLLPITRESVERLQGPVVEQHARLFTSSWAQLLQPCFLRSSSKDEGEEEEADSAAQYHLQQQQQTSAPSLSNAKTGTKREEEQEEEQEEKEEDDKINSSNNATDPRSPPPRADEQEDLILHTLQHFLANAGASSNNATATTTTMGSSSAAAASTPVSALDGRTQQQFLYIYRFVVRCRRTASVQELKKWYSYDDLPF